MVDVVLLMFDGRREERRLRVKKGIFDKAAAVRGNCRTFFRLSMDVTRFVLWAWKNLSCCFA